MSESECARWLAETGARAEARLSELLRLPSAPPQLRDAMRYAALGGGRRLRPAMTLAVAGSASAAAALDAACALECVHCYSLAHDDLPCMDAADMRRGALACHIAHGEATALLAGDCLHSLAFEILADCGLPSAATGLLARAAGAEGMGGGQALDLRAEAADEPSLRRMHELKTGALFDCALQLGLLCRATEKTEKAEETESRRLREFAAAFGRLFQIANDIKDAAADSALGRATYVTVLGEERARRLAREARGEAADALRGGHPILDGLAELVLRGVR